MLDINPASVLYHGPYHDGLADELAAKIDPARQEGFVLRDEGPIPYPSGNGDAGRFFAGRLDTPVLAKWVREKHVATDEHWMSNWRDAPRPPRADRARPHRSSWPQHRAACPRSDRKSTRLNSSH